MREIQMRYRTSICAVAITAMALFTTSSFSDEQEHARSGETAEIPETAAQIWHAIDEQIKLLGDTINNNNLDDVHHIAFAIHDLAKGLLNKSKGFQEAKLKLLRGYVNRIGEHAENLDTYGDKGDKSKTQNEFTQLKKRLDYMRKMYPASVFKHNGEDHGHRE